MRDLIGIIIISIVNIHLIGLGIFVLSGWGDSLIAGYNTASKKEQQKYDIKRLRLIDIDRLPIAILFIVPVVISTPLFLGKEDNDKAHIVTTIVCVIVVIVGVVLANTWCKK